MSRLPPLGAVAKRVAHDVRGPVGVIVAALHEIELIIAELGDDSRGEEFSRLLEMARRGTRKLERTATTMDAIGVLEAPTPSGVDLHPMVITAIERMKRAERRPQVVVNGPAPGQTVRVRVAPQLFSHAIEEVLAYAIRRSASEVRVTISSPVTTSTAPDQAQTPQLVSLVVTMVGADVVPASAVPFEDPLGLAAHLFEVQHVSFTIDKQDDGVTLLVGVPSP